MIKYMDFISSSMVTFLVGLKVTVRQFFTKPSTREYPEERPVVAERYRGIHVLDKETCIGCLQCARACPIDCITIKTTRDKVTKKMTLDEFSIDYNVCMFCHLCIEPCPVECIDMSRTYEFNVTNREDLVLNMLNPQHGYNSTSKEGVAQGRGSDFYPGFTPSLMHVLNPSLKKESFDESQVWSRSQRTHDYAPQIATKEREEKAKLEAQAKKEAAAHKEEQEKGIEGMQKKKEEGEKK